MKVQVIAQIICQLAHVAKAASLPKQAIPAWEVFYFKNSIEVFTKNLPSHATYLQLACCARCLSCCICLTLACCGFAGNEGITCHYNNVGLASLPANTSLLDTAHFFAIFNAAQFDGRIAYFTMKYDHLFWRPITAAHQLIR